MPRILLEDTSDFIVEKQSIEEAVATGVKFPVVIRGRLSVCDEKNGNNRIYPKKVWERQVNSGSRLSSLIEKNRSLGLLEHPKDGEVSLLSPICLSLRRVWLKEAKGDSGNPVNEVWGEVAILGTPEGRKLWALIEGGYNPLVSSRGFGSVNRRPDGLDEVCEDFECEGWDAVWTPSFTKAELDGKTARESVQPTKLKTPTAWESMTPEERFTAINHAVNEGKIHAASPGHDVSVKLEDGIVKLAAVPMSAPVTESTKKEVAEAAAKTVSEKTSPQTTKYTMEKLKPIQESIRTLQSVNASGLEPVRIAEHLAHVAELHRQVAAVTAEDPKISWDGNRLHEELNRIEQRLNETAKAPAVRLAKLEEREQKTLKTLNAVAQLGVKFRSKLAESRKSLEAVKADLAESIRRGRGWMERAKLAEAKVKKLDEKYTVATDALDIMTERYHADTSALARQLMIVEMKIEDKDVIARLEEANTVKKLHAIKTELTEFGKYCAPGKKAEKKAEKKEDEKEEKEEKAAEGKKKVSESAQTPQPIKHASSVITATTIRPFSITENASLARRLSQAQVNG